MDNNLLIAFFSNVYSFIFILALWLFSAIIIFKLNIEIIKGRGYVKKRDTFEKDWIVKLNHMSWTILLCASLVLLLFSLPILFNMAGVYIWLVMMVLTFILGDPVELLWEKRMIFTDEIWDFFIKKYENRKNIKTK